MLDPASLPICRLEPIYLTLTWTAEVDMTRGNLSPMPVWRLTNVSPSPKTTLTTDP
jgi:hypothetical protein